MSRTEIIKFQFFSLQISCHFQYEMALGTLLGFPFKMADKVADLKLTCYHFLKTLNLRNQNLLSRVIQLLITGDQVCIFAGQPLFTNFILLRSEDKGGIL